MADIEELRPCPNKMYPTKIEGLTAGETKYWCTCGLSKSQPFCDGSHKDTGFKPMVWKVPESTDGTYWLCQCKYSKNKPLCDGSHKAVAESFPKAVAACQEDHAAVIKLCTKCGYTPPV